jgi:hypothetical protein
LSNKFRWFINFITCIILVVCNFSNYAYSQELRLVHENVYSDYKSNRLGVNDTFTIAGSLVSTINPFLVQDNPQYKTNNEQNSTIDLGHISEEMVGNMSSPETLKINSNSLALMGPLANKSVTPDNSFSIGRGVNQTDNLSNNLVSMLTGIIIQSIENGNPTINPMMDTSDDTINSNVSIIVSGNWVMEVINGNVTNFDARFVMLSSDASGFHWHSLDNLKTNQSVSFGVDDTIILEGNIDFFTDDGLTVKNGNIYLIINNFELIEIIFLNNKISNHFFSFPIYGTIDSIKIKN